MAQTSGPVVSTRTLNRTLLHRQLLLERSAMPPLQAVEYLVGLQAQLPLDPYTALWSRLDGFDPMVLSGHVARREAVRLVVMRGTLHLVTAEDARVLSPRMAPTLAKVFGGTAWGRQVRDLPSGEYEAFRGDARALLKAQPMTAAQLAKGMEERWSQIPEQARRSMTYILPVAQITPRGEWGKTLQPTWANLDDWLGKPLRKPIPLANLVRRYLAVFGPASVADFQNWSRLPAMRETFEGMRQQLRTYRSETGRELFDLPDAELVPEDVPAPVRFLPTYDNVVLGHDDRSRIVPPRHGKNAFITEDRNVGSVLVDGFVRACWTVSTTKKQATLAVETLAPTSKVEQRQIEAAGRALLAFAHPETAHEVTFRPYTGPPARPAR